VTPAIIGIPLNGTNGTAAIRDTDDGRFDGDTVWDRAVGPFQFIPSSWAIYGQDGNGDGDRNPNNIYDAVPAAVAHLCPSGTVTDTEAAIFAYNRSTAYVQLVLEWAALYSGLLSAIIDGSITSVIGNAEVYEPDASSRCGNTVIVTGIDGARYTYCRLSVLAVSPKDTSQRRADPRSQRSANPHRRAPGTPPARISTSAFRPTATASARTARHPARHTDPAHGRAAEWLHGPGPATNWSSWLDQAFRTSTRT